MGLVAVDPRLEKAEKVVKCMLRHLTGVSPQATSEISHDPEFPLLEYAEYEGIP